MTCRHVNIVATEKQLINDCGIIQQATINNLLSGNAFAVSREVMDEDGVRLYLVNPKSETHILWVWDYLTEEVG